MTIRRAFTLVELLVVISIIGMLSSIAIISTSGSREKARLAAAMSFAAQLDRANGALSGGEWFLNEGSGTTVLDGTGNGQNGTLLNVPTWSTDTKDNKGFSVHLNGINSYISIPDSSSLKYRGGNLTMAVWVKTDPTETDGACILSKPWNSSGEYNYRICLYSNRAVYAALSGNVQYVLSTTASVPAGVWSFVAVTVDSAQNMNIYIDGGLKATGVDNVSSWSPAGGDSNNPLAVGTLYPYGNGWTGNSAFTLAGFVDDPRVFNDALSSERIHKLYAEGKAAHLFEVAQR